MSADETLTSDMVRSAQGQETLIQMMTALGQEHVLESCTGADGTRDEKLIEALLKQVHHSDPGVLCLHLCVFVRFRAVAEGGRIGGWVRGCVGVRPVRG